MKQILIIFLLLPLFSLAQKKPKKTYSVKTVSSVKKAADEYIINGTTKGFPDGTKVAILNGLTAASELETTVKKNKFTLKGKIAAPDFKLLAFNGQPPYTTILLDNSILKAYVNKDSMYSARLTGSKTHTEYQNYIQSLQPYQMVFDENAPYDSVIEKIALGITSGYVTKFPKSYVAPLAIIHYNQITEDINKVQELYNALDSNTKITPMGNYVVQLIESAKQTGIGKPMEDFTQADTAGNPVTLSSYKGKYVLVDFWASWCRPCRMENPNVVAAYNQFHNKNFTVLGVSLDKGKQAWQDAIQMDGLTWTHVSDLQGWQNAVAQKNGIYQIPKNILIDTEGKIISRDLRGTKLIKKLSRILK
jgi:peroxiredoxin